MLISLLRLPVNKLNALAHRLSLNNALVLKVMMLSALIIVTARVIAPFEIGKDQALQMEAAERLIDGRGLTTTYFVSAPNDISQHPIAHNLTWWPPFFSVILAAFLVTGMPLVVVLKTVYGAVTLLGWLGWAVLASHFLAQPFKLREKKYPIHLLLAALIPILFTPLWNGTEVFLWAGAPPVFLCLSKRVNGKSSLRSVAIAGLLFGSLYAIRYSSLFIGLAAIVILFQVSYPTISSFLKRVALFAATSGIGILPTLIYVKLFSQDTGVLPEVAAVGTIPRLSGRIITAVLFNSPVVSNLIFGFSLPERLIFGLHVRPLVMVVGSVFLLAILCLPFVLGKTYQIPWRENLALGLSILPVSLVVFLLVVTFVSGITFFREQRYYLPISLCGVLIFYQLFVIRGVPRLLNGVGGSVVFTLLAYIFVFLPFQALIPGQRVNIVRQTLGFSLSKHGSSGSTSRDLRYPSFELYSLKESSRQKLIELKKQSPEAIFYTDNYSYYVYDSFEAGGPEPGIDFRRFPLTRNGYWSNAYTSQTVTVYWVMDNPDDLKFVPDSNRKLIYYDPYEKTAIFLSEFQAGTSFSNNHVAVRTKQH